MNGRRRLTGAQKAAGGTMQRALFLSIRPRAQHHMSMYVNGADLIEIGLHGGHHSNTRSRSLDGVGLRAAVPAVVNSPFTITS
jgi:hypothetical protein